MKLAIVLEHHFLRTADGRVWTETNFGRALWDRYLRIFDEVRIVARTRDVEGPDAAWVRVDGEKVSVAHIPDFVGPWQFLCRRRKIRNAVATELGEAEAIILRVPGTLGTVSAKLLFSLGQPFGVEVAGDPFDVFSRGAVEHPLRPLFRWWFVRNLRRQCRRAAASLYVTKYTLQQRYPPGGPECASSTRVSMSASDVDMPDTAFAASNVEMPERAFVSQPRHELSRAASLKLLSIGSMAQPYKGHDIAIRAVRLCLDAGVAVELTLVGDGRERPILEGLAKSLSVSEHINFRGQLPAGSAVRRELDMADVFVVASRVEGLPRALVEAMGRGLPCIGTSVGGIPEVLPPDALVPPDDPVALASQIAKMRGDGELRRAMAVRNLEMARTFRDSELQPKREAFYRAVVSATEKWDGKRSKGSPK